MSQSRERKRPTQTKDQRELSVSVVHYTTLYAACVL